MYKRIKGKKFGRATDQRRAFMRSLAANLIMNERIETTKVRARQTSSLVEKLITKAKKNDLAAKKALAALVPEAAAKKLVAVIAPRFSARQGGYTRVVKLGLRSKDGAPMAIVEILGRVAAKPAENAKSGKAKAKTAKAKSKDKPAAAKKEPEKVNA